MPSSKLHSQRVAKARELVQQTLGIQRGTKSEFEFHVIRGVGRALRCMNADELFQFDQGAHPI
eukprot:11167545-Lingulodinium_polyedra.AAC.1